MNVNATNALISPEPSTLIQVSTYKPPVQYWNFGHCSICKTVDTDILVNERFRASKVLFCSDKCKSVWVECKRQLDEAKKPNQLKLAYTGKP